MQAYHVSTPTVQSEVPAIVRLGAFVATHCRESFADDLVDAAGPYVEPTAADRDWLERMEAREIAEEELERQEWAEAYDAYLNATVGRPEPHNGYSD